MEGETEAVEIFEMTEVKERDERGRRKEEESRWGLKEGTRGERKGVGRGCAERKREGK